MGVFSRAELKRHHKRAHRNEFGARGASYAGCFCCLEVFEPSAVRHWIDHRPNRSAMCPHCGIDSVLFARLNPLSPQLLHEMGQLYFESCDLSSIRPRLKTRILMLPYRSLKGSSQSGRRRVKRMRQTLSQIAWERSEAERPTTRRCDGVLLKDIRKRRHLTRGLNPLVQEF